MSTIQFPPPGYEAGEARRRYVEHYGAAIMLARYQQVALVCLALVALGLLVLNVRTHQAMQGLKPLVIRIDDVGRATAVTYDRFAYKPQGPELRFFLTQFVTQHYGRVRATVRANYAARSTSSTGGWPMPRSPPTTAATPSRRSSPMGATKSRSR